MSVYIDPIMSTLKSRQWPYTRGCHLFADSISELHIFANLIGLKKSWFQNRIDMPHYDLTSGMRKKAIQYGAVDVTAVFMVKMMQKRCKNRMKKTKDK